ncbi:methylmalonic aciduria type A homolog, mitochondrial-like isoform X2 [Acanthaster planci]|uniref:Methylmalonic aciduria type A homolog, mitochondrial-like isoform X2 n=1 Tax=Acanthaster planci TaxID=133434 RepID=A0A8B7XZ97_ACAPL|nr:methylmalonic aciduria type A homolog, mitochondrial-like isoform X2 [Acanthaster planci]
MLRMALWQTRFFCTSFLLKALPWATKRTSFAHRNSQVSRGSWSRWSQTLRTSVPATNSVHKTSASQTLDKESLAKKLFHQLVGGHRAAIAQCITLVESTHHGKQAQARELLAEILAYLKKKTAENDGIPTSFRIGLTGPPGAGKSTFIEAFGKQLTEAGHKVAVLAVDPSSSYSGGSLLGDKTRMPELTRDMSAYIRASPTAGTLGGVARNTNDAIVVCEGAGFNIILVETVAGGDELQGIKRGIVEKVDLILVSKADGELKVPSRRVKAEYTSALKIMRKRSQVWSPKVMQVSALTKTGLTEAWETMEEYHTIMIKSKLFLPKRAHQHRTWMWNHIRDNILDIFRCHPEVRPEIPQMEAEVSQGRITAGMAADLLLSRFRAKATAHDNGL